MARAICELWDLVDDSLEYVLIYSIDQFLLEYPNPQLEMQNRNFEEYTLNMGLNDYLYYELLLAAHNHMIESFKKIIMASRIKRHFKKAISDPSHQMCRTRLMREFCDQGQLI